MTFTVFPVLLLAAASYFTIASSPYCLPSLFGVSLLAGVALGTLVSPWFLAIAAFFGAGLTFAGATGTCGLGLVLLRMPWNRPRPIPPEGVVAACAAGGGATATCATPAAPPG